MKNDWLVLDWDGTLAYSALLSEQSETDLNQFPTFVRALSLDRNGTEGPTALFIRSKAKNFLKRISKEYNLILWTFGTQKYIKDCMQATGFDKYFTKIIFREMMKQPIKDLFQLKVPLNRVAILDDSNDTFGILNPVNCIDIPSWYPYDEDTILDVIDTVIHYHFKNILSQYSSHDLENRRTEIIRTLNILNQKQKV
jgi:TFIIF-interacting CTD phosphatase-like protein